MAMTTIAEDAVWHLHLSDHTVPFGGPSVGRDAIRASYFNILKDWDYIQYQPQILDTVGDTVRYRIAFQYRYRRTGATLSGSCRGTVVVKDGLINRIDEYHDAALINAFMRMADPPP